MRRFTSFTRSRLFAGQRTVSAQVHNTIELTEYHKRLGLAIGASNTEIKAAYRRRALECHPDVVPLTDKASAESEFRRVSEAYAILSNGARPSPKATSTDGPSKHSTRRSPVRSSIERDEPASNVRRSQHRQGPFVRKDADRFFRDAFDGKTIDDIMFQARLRDRRAHRRRLATDDSEQKPVGHEEVLRHVMSNAAKQFAERLAKEYGHDTVKNTRFFRFRGASQQPPSSTIPFRPFTGQQLPPGVSSPELPTPGTPSHISEENLQKLSASSQQSEPSIALLMPLGSLNPGSRSHTLESHRKASFMSHNAGQVYSYHRAY